MGREGGRGGGARFREVMYRNKCVRISHKLSHRWGTMEGQYGWEQLVRRHEGKSRRLGGGEIQSTMNTIICHKSVYYIVLVSFSSFHLGSGI